VFTGFRLGSLKVIDYWEDLGVGGRITKLDLREIGIDGTNWIWLVQHRV